MIVSWERCGTCNGTKKVHVSTPTRRSDVCTWCLAGNSCACPDCVDGLVPNEGTVEAAARGSWSTYDWAWGENATAEGRVLWDVCLTKARRGLLAAARWEREQ